VAGRCSAVAVALALAALGAPAGEALAHATRSPSAAPSNPPLTAGQAGAGAAAEEPGTRVTPHAESDPLVSNGLGSPTCSGALSAELSATDRRDCETSGFLAASAPTGDFGIDVDIDTGPFGIGTGVGLSLVQEFIVTPLWMGLVWAVHALVVISIKVGL